MNRRGSGTDKKILDKTIDRGVKRSLSDQRALRRCAFMKMQAITAATRLHLYSGWEWTNVTECVNLTKRHS